ncbi:MAG: hypothetical protein KAS64_03875 [Spirochaetes bacterium]|nr:hypothetical protein [Spirochaetota bacterium]
MYKKMIYISMVLLLIILLSGCDVLFGGGDDYSKYASSSSSDSTGAINSDLFNIQAPVNGENIYTASTHFKWYYNGDTSKVMYYRIFNEGSMIEIPNTGGNFFDRELYNIVSGQQNYWSIEAVDTNWNILARSENFSFNCDASGGTNNMPTGITPSNTFKDQIQILWNSPSDNPKIFKIYGRHDGKTFFVGIENPWNIFFNHQYLVPEMNIEYAVVSVDWKDQENLSGWFGGSTVGADRDFAVPFTDSWSVGPDSTIYYKVNVPSSQQVYIQLDISVTLPFDGEVKLLRSNGEHVRGEDMYGDGVDESFDVYLETGDYFIVVRNKNAMNGDYVLDVHF